MNPKTTAVGYSEVRIRDIGRKAFLMERAAARSINFYNPIWQNDTHIKALQWVLGDTRVNIYSYIVFGDECRLMDIRPKYG